MPLMQSGDLQAGIRADLIATLAQLHGKHLEADDHDDERPAKKRRRDLESLKSNCKDKTEQVLFAVQNKVPLSRMTNVVRDAQALLENLSASRSSGSSHDDIEALLVSRQTVGMQMLLLDGALSPNY